MCLKKRGDIIRIINFLIFTFLIICFESTIYAQAFKRLNVSEKAMEISLKDLNGKQISLSDYKDKKTLAVIFWKNPNLRSPNALAYLQKLYEKYKDSNNLEVISVYCPDVQQGVPSNELDGLQKVIEDKKVTYPVLLDEGLKIFSQYGIITFPSTMILDTNGVVQYIMPGFPTFGAEKDILANLKKILGIPEEKVAAQKYEPDLDAGRNYKLAIAVLQRGNTDKAVDYLNIAVGKDPKYAAPHALLGKIYVQMKKNEKAIESFQKAIELDSEDTDSLIDYGFLCMEMGMKDDALLQFRHILELSPQKAAEAYYGMGTIYLKNEAYDSALLKVKEAIKLYSQQKQISRNELAHFALSYLNLAEIEIKNSNKKEAIEGYKEALKKYDELTKEILKDAEKSVRAN
ncbi:redoxin domain-containing protein [Candidatus Poribacteria bacterium]|nr:redoxin domain-containing protein [Candidatus Poribacteria bacterium]